MKELLHELRIPYPWNVRHIQHRQKKIVVELGRASVPYDCPKCGKNASVYDTKARTWRHTNLMNCRIELIADVPRVECSTCGMNTIVVPWAYLRSRNSIMFELWVYKNYLLSGDNIQQLSKWIDYHHPSIERIGKHYQRQECLKALIDDLWVDSQFFASVDPESILPTSAVEQIRESKSVQRSSIQKKRISLGRGRYEEDYDDESWDDWMF